MLILYSGIAHTNFFIKLSQNGPYTKTLVRTNEFQGVESFLGSRLEYKDPELRVRKNSSNLVCS
jgi:hypothetical protein